MDAIENSEMRELLRDEKCLVYMQTGWAAMNPAHSPHAARG